MADYPYGEFTIVSGTNPDNLAGENDYVLIHAPGDATRTPIEIRDLGTGQILGNPIESNRLARCAGFIATIPEAVAYAAGPGIEVLLESTAGMRNAAVESAASAASSESAAQTAAATAAAAAQADLEARIAAGQFEGPQGPPGVNAVENDTAVASYINTPGTEVRDALNATFARVFTPEAYGAKGDWNGTTGTDDTAAVQAAIDAAELVNDAVVRLTRKYMIPGGITIEKPLTIDGEGVGELHSGPTPTATTLVNVQLATVGSRFTMKGVRRIHLPDTAGGKVLSLTNVRGSLEDMTIRGGDTALFIGNGTNETFFSKLLMQAKTHVVDTVIDVSNAENSFTNCRIFGNGSNVQSAFRATTVNGGDIGAYYFNDVVAAMTGSNCQVGLRLDGTGATTKASHPFFMNQTAFDGVVTAFDIRAWGNIIYNSGWCYATGTNIFRLENVNDITVTSNLLKGGTNAFRFEGAIPSSIMTEAENRYPDAQTVYSFGAGATVSRLIAGRGIQTGGGTTDNLVEFIKGARNSNTPIQSATRFYLDSNSNQGDLLFINEMAQILRMRAADGELQFRNADGGEVEHRFGHTGTFKARVGVGSGRFATASRPTAASVGAGVMVVDSTLNKPIWSDGTNWRDATGTIV